ncbi:hypothetical protein ACFQ0B_72720 [Nonomuraea thailandensis]
MAKQQERIVDEPPVVRETSTAEQYERYVGGSPEAERVILERLAGDLMRVQLKIKERSGAAGIDRAFHAKAILGVENARLRFHTSLPEELRTGFAQPGAEYPVIVRLSNASGVRQPDSAPDLRGAALRIQVGAEETHDLLMTNHPVSHAANAREFVVFAQVMAGATTTLRKAVALYVKLPWALGWSTAARMRRNVLAGTRREVRSLALETYWSRGAILWGQAGPVRYRLRPAAVSPSAVPVPREDADYLSHELAARLASQDVVFDLCVQRYEDAGLTPVEDGAADWPDADVPVVPVATLTIPRQDVGTADARAAGIRIDRLAFDPWNTTDEFRPWATSTARARPPTRPAAPIAADAASSRPRRDATSSSAPCCAARSACSTGTSPGTGCRPGSACSTSRPSGRCCAATT